jgi:hypothetical protein
MCQQGISIINIPKALKKNMGLYHPIKKHMQKFKQCEGCENDHVFGKQCRTCKFVKLSRTKAEDKWSLWYNVLI